MVDYSKLSTSELKMKLRELEAEYGKEMSRNYDDSLRDALALNEYRIIKEELENRAQKGVVRLNVDESLSKIFTPKRIALFNAITGRETIKSLAKKLNRNPKSIARDIAVLEDFGIVRKKKRGREVEVELAVKEIVIFK
ncbi:MAG: hypothetical protein GXO66_00170 [Euryarchaeota archaeon]|nr:hypothetical protein [Euryarchaeota archaeon]